MKYRRLDKTELSEMEQEFVRFLATRSIPGSDWERMKTEQPDRVDALLDEFSDLVFEKILTGVDYLELRAPHDLKIFKCTKDKMQLIGLAVEDTANIDFTKNDEAVAMMQKLQQSGAQLKMYRAEKAYKDNREHELFAMMEAGCLIADGSLYHTLDGLAQ